MFFLFMMYILRMQSQQLKFVLAGQSNKLKCTLLWKVFHVWHESLDNTFHIPIFSVEIMSSVWNFATRISDVSHVGEEPRMRWEAAIVSGYIKLDSSWFHRTIYLSLLWKTNAWRTFDLRAKFFIVLVPHSGHCSLDTANWSLLTGYNKGRKHSCPMHS